MAIRNIEYFNVTKATVFPPFSMQYMPVVTITCICDSININSTKGDGLNPPLRGVLMRGTFKKF